MKLTSTLTLALFCLAVPVRGADMDSATEALDEVNAVRARAGLYPYLRDPGLTAAAQSAAAFRANRLIAGHTANDFTALPDGCWARAAGCAA